jgi:glycine/D-amino acid oxidase-like deaminating enzyme
VAARTDGHKVYWQRLLPTGNLLFGGGQFSIPSPSKRLSPIMTERKADSLIEELRNRYPFLSATDVDCFWSGAITGPAGERPVIANVGNSGRITLVQTCFGHGMGLAPAIGDAVVEHINPSSPGSVGARILLGYATPTPSFMRWAEGFVFRLLANSPMRYIANAILKP